MSSNLFGRLVARLSKFGAQPDALPKYTDPVEQQLADQIMVALPSLNLAFEEARRLVDLQQSQIDALDAKAQVFLALIGIVLAALYSNLKNLQDMHVSTLTLAGVGLAAVLLAFSAGLALWSYRIRKWTASPNLAELKDYFTWTETLTKYSLFDTMDILFNQNARETNRKALLLSWSHGVFLAVIAILLVVFLGNLVLVK
jgi:hypothetical protein